MDWIVQLKGYLNACNVRLELYVSLLHVITPGREQILTHVLIKVTCNRRTPGINLIYYNIRESRQCLFAINSKTAQCTAEKFCTQTRIVPV